MGPLRLLYTIYAYIVGLPIFLLFNLTTAPVIRFSAKSGPFYYVAGKFWSTLLYRALGLRVTVIGQSQLPSNGRYIVASNHQSLMDIPLMFLVLPRPYAFMFKRELLDAPIFGWHLRHAGQFCVERGHGTNMAELATGIQQHLAEGNPLVVFAEGTRSTSGKLLPLKRGAFLLAMKAGVPIVPVYIRDSGKFKPKNRRTAWPQPITITIGQAIPAPEFTNEHELRERSQALMQATTQALQAVENA